MKNKRIVKRWMEFSEMDRSTAVFIYENMHPKPLEIICYHCQQAAEKIIKALVIAIGGDLQKTHDLGLLIEEIAASVDVSDIIYDACADLTPYGVTIRYPQEYIVDDDLVKKALADMTLISSWAQEKIDLLT